MTTEKQMAANRRNARHSTGPKTARGKATSAQNATRHGLLAQTVVLHDEDPEECAAFYTAIREELLTLMRQKLSRSRGRWQCG